jgi:hypothetical protein
MPYKGRGTPPKYGEGVCPLTRSYNGHEIPATSPDREVSRDENGRIVNLLFLVPAERRHFRHVKPNIDKLET